MSTQSRPPDAPRDAPADPPRTDSASRSTGAADAHPGEAHAGQTSPTAAEAGERVDVEVARRALKLTTAPNAALAEKLLDALARARPARLDSPVEDEAAAARLSARAAEERARRRQQRALGGGEETRAGVQEPLRPHEEAAQPRGAPAHGQPRSAVSVPPGHPLATVPLTELPFAVLDFETTGLFAGAAEILEVGVYHVQGGRIVPSFASLVRPRGRIPGEVTALTGIDAALVRDAPPLEEVLPRLEAALAGRVLVAHNAAFDRSFLQRALEDLHRPPFDGPVVCTQRLARRVRPDLQRRSLDFLCEAYGLPNRARHRARGDAEVTARLLVEFLELGDSLGAHTLAELAALCDEKPRGGVDFSRYAFGPARLAHLPRTPGVYRMLDRAGEVLYVGKARDLRQRVGSYFTGRARGKLAALREQLYDLQLTPCDSELEALLLESAEIRRLLPRLNVQVKVQRRGFWLKVSRRGSGPPRVVSATAAAPGLFGPFVDGAGGREVARRLRLAFELAGSPAYPQIEPEAFLSRGEGAQTLVQALEVALSRCAPSAEPKRAEDLRQTLRCVRRIAATRATVGSAHHRRDLVVRLPASTGIKLFLLRDGSPLQPLAVGSGPAEEQLEVLHTELLRLLALPPEAEGSAGEGAHDGLLLLDAWLERHPPAARLDLGEALGNGRLREQLEALLRGSPPPLLTELF